MHRRLVFALGFVIVMSVAGLAGLGVVAALDRAQMEQLTRRELLNARLDALSTEVGQSVQNMVAEVSRAMLQVPDTLDDRRSFHHGLVRQLFATDVTGILVFPPTTNASVSELDFLRRTEAIWSGQALLRAEEPADGDSAAAKAASEPPSSSVSEVVQRTLKSRSRPEQKRQEVPQQNAIPQQNLPAQQNAVPQVQQQLEEPPAQASPPSSGGQGTLMHLARRRDSGTVGWFWQEGLHLLYWRLTEGGTIVGAELDRVAVVSRLVAAIEPQVGEGIVELLDDRGRIVASWGDAKVNAKAARIQRALPTPLHSFSLAYRPTSAESKQGGLPMGALAGLAAFVLALAALGVWIVRESSRELREASERVTFVTQVSHELKTPLTNIRLYAELLDRRMEDDEVAQDKLHVIGAESRRLGRLVDNILAFARVRRGTLALEPTEVEVDPVLDRIVRQFGPSLEAREIQVQRSGSAPMPVRGDVDALEQVFSNLIGNVEKYAAGGHRVFVEVEQNAKTTKIRVGDAGPGVPALARPKVFEPFYRASDKLSDGVTGTGIGLSIARTLARRLKGDLRLLDRSPGAWFELELETKETS